MTEQEVIVTAMYQAGQHIRVFYDPRPWVITRMYWSEEAQSICYDLEREGATFSECPEGRLIPPN